MMYLPDETNDSVIYVFATKGGAPSNPDWYYNLTTAGEGSIERGTDSYPVTVREVTGDERDRRLRRTSQLLPRLRRLHEANRRHPHHPRP
jgi:deazaflavin-dependent oxidoreductase (nitroreductase family)